MQILGQLGLQLTLSRSTGAAIDAFDRVVES